MRCSSFGTVAAGNARKIGTLAEEDSCGNVHLLPVGRLDDRRFHLVTADFAVHTCCGCPQSTVADTTWSRHLLPCVRDAETAPVATARGGACSLAGAWKCCLWPLGVGGFDKVFVGWLFRLPNRTALSRCWALAVRPRCDQGGTVAALQDLGLPPT